MEKSRERQIEVANNEKVGPTAWSVAYKRTLADIPYAQEIFDEFIPAIESASQDEQDYFNQTKDSKNTAQIEARYKMINKILEEQNPRQVLEIAVGLSSRGFAMAKDDPGLKYAEVDLPNMMAEKQKAVTSMQEKLGLDLPNLNLSAGNALDYESLRKAIDGFDSDDITIVNEGLLRYLTLDQKAKVAENVHRILEEFGGVWVTPDITTKKVILSTSKKGKEYQRISDLAGIDIDANSFQDVEQAKEFFEEKGFEVTVRKLSEIEDELVTPDKLNLPKQEAHDTIKNVVVFVMKPANK